MALPAIFFGHGNPMNALARNSYTEEWRRMGEGMPMPKAVLCISAHWYVPEAAATVSAAPKTIHDFGGFPLDLYQVRYPAPGAPELGRRVQQLLQPVPLRLDESRGLDHGVWSVLCHVYPDASVPIVQLSLDQTQPACWHFEIGQRLAPLRDEGVLIAGSGNLVHNLREYAWGRRAVEPYDWAVRFEADARRRMLAGGDDALIDYEGLGSDAALAIPTPEHYLPLLYVLAARRPGEPITFPIEGIDGGSVSMLAVKVGS